MNAVVLTAVLSCLNSGLYTASRMLFVLGARREAPPTLIKVNSPRGAGLGDPGLDGRRLPQRHRRLRLARHRVPLPAQLLRCGDPLRLPADRGLAVRPAPPRRRVRADGEDVAVPVADPRRRRGHRRGAGADGASAPTPGRSCCSACSPSAWSSCSTGSPCGAAARCRSRRSRRSARARRPGPGAGPPGAGARQPDADRRGAARRAGASCRAASRRTTTSSSRPTRSTPVRPTGRARRSCGRRRRRPPAGGSSRPWRCCASAGSPSTASSGTTDRWSPWSRRCADFDADHVVISTQPDDQSTWLHHDVVGQGEGAPGRPGPPRRGPRARPAALTQGLRRACGC